MAIPARKLAPLSAISVKRRRRLNGTLPVLAGEHTRLMDTKTLLDFELLAERA